MQHNKYGYVCSTETKIFSDLERWLADKKKRERHDKKHGAFSLEKNKEESIMNFGEALEELKAGKSVARDGWNGKGQYVFLIKGTELSTGLKYGYGEYEGEPQFTDVLAIKTTANQIQVGWLASQSDMLADDWAVVE